MAIFSAKKFLGLACLLAALLACSCGKTEARRPVFPVQGKVLFDGKPLANAFLVFHPLDDQAAPRPVAYAEGDGSFVPTTYDSADGAPVGSYAVTVEWRRPPSNEETLPSENLLPARYAKAATTPLKIQIREGENNLETFQVKR